MRIENTASAALSNLGRAAAESSGRIARSSQDPQVDLGRELVTLNGIQQAYKANVVVLRTGAELTGAIIDMYA